MKLRYSPRAAFDIDRIHDTIARRSPKGATKVVARTRIASEFVAGWPGAGTRTDKTNVRRLPIGRNPYVPYFKIDAAVDEVTILHVRHGARRSPKPEDLSAATSIPVHNRNHQPGSRSCPT